MKKAAFAALAVALALPCAAAPSLAAAQPDYGWHGDEGRRDWDPADHYDRHRRHDRVLTREDYVYRGGDGRYYCKRNDGTTGLVVGGIGGALIGNAMGGGHALGTLLGAAGGAAIGRSIDRGRVHCR
jgi:hypothetical protein